MIFIQDGSGERTFTQQMNIKRDKKILKQTETTNNASQSNCDHEKYPFGWRFWAGKRSEVREREMCGCLLPKQSPVRVKQQKQKNSDVNRQKQTNTQTKPYTQTHTLCRAIGDIDCLW